MQYFLLSLAVLLATCNLYAQPYGCHYHDHNGQGQEFDPVMMAMERGWTARSDSFDVLHYDIFLDVPSIGSMLKGNTKVMFTPKLEALDTITFDLAKFTVDSVLIDGNHADFIHADPYLKIVLPQAGNVDDTMQVHVFYRGAPLKDPSWGGFYFEGTYAYNLGIGITSNPPNFGRAWYPCFDNFLERATYDIRILSYGGRRGYGIGDLVEEIPLGGDSIIRHYVMNQLLPTYLTNVAVGPYVAHRDTHLGAYGPVPIELLGFANNINTMVDAFSHLGSALDAMEYWYGPYPWSRVGYVLTSAGAMEHPTNVAFPINSLNNGVGDTRLMAHELGHHWWGNITTLREPTDMWIKEGNAEYTSHLHVEWKDGRDAFVNTVKSNHQNVLTFVHQQDGGFLRLSGIPFANIYGRHTYLKGASVLHNMRGYLGDSLFRAGQQSILENHAYTAINAETYNQHLSQATGVDMTPYFNAWIYEPGFASFEIHDWSAVGSDSVTWVNLMLRQGVREAPALHESVPLEVSFYSKNWEVFYATIQAGGEYSSHSVAVPFEPVHIALNERYLLNQARMDHQQIIKAPGNYIYPFVKFRVIAEEVPDSALVRVDHQWIAPEAIMDQPELRISSTNFWVVSGIFPEGFKAQGRLTYNGKANNAFMDLDLVGSVEDSLILLYKAKGTDKWIEHPDYDWLNLSKTDQQGDMRINVLAPGAYALAKGRFINTQINSTNLLDQVRVFPNPGNGPLHIYWPDIPSRPMLVQIFNLHGQLAYQTQLSDVYGNMSIEVPMLQPGMYFMNVHTTSGEIVQRKLIRK